MNVPPRYARPFVGREDLLDAILMALGHRGGVFTLGGRSGIGKTRLAAELAGRWEERSCWVDLQSARDGVDLRHAITHALHLPLDCDVSAGLAGLGSVLVVLDNLDHLSEVGRDALADWVIEAPSVRFLVTSRQRLGLGMETMFQLPPLTREAAQEMLFHSGSTPRGDIIEALLAPLKGVPLAIELAAGRLEILEPAQLLQRMDDPLSVLVAPAGGGRHGTVDASIAWSWQLLSAHERDVLAQTTVFRGPFSLEAAEAVLDADDTLEVLHRLCGCHLVQSQRGRFRLAEAVRLFAATNGSVDEARARHAVHYQQWCLGLVPQLEERRSRDALDAITADFANLRAAIEHGDDETACVVSYALSELLDVRGPSSELLEVTDIGLERASAYPTWGALLLRQRTRHHERVGDTASIERDLGRALMLAEGEPRLTALVQVRIGDVAVVVGDLEAAREAYEAARVSIGGRDPELLAAIVIQLALLAHGAGDELQSDGLQSQALTLALASGSILREAKVRGQIARIAIERLDYGRAREENEIALALYQELELPRAIAYTSGQLGHIAELIGDVMTARAYYQVAYDGATTAGDKRLKGTWLGYLGRIELELTPARGKARLADAIEILQKVSAHRLVETFHATLASQAAREGDEATCARHADACTQHPPALRAFWLEVAGIRTGDALTRARAAAEVLIDETSTTIAERQRNQHQILSLLEAVEQRSRTVQVHSDGTLIRRPNGEETSLRGANARLVSHLLTTTTSSNVEDLFAAGWPGERAQPKSARNRVYVALSTLRKFGLRAHIHREGSGWILDTSDIHILEPA